jgi:putative transposase
VKDFATREIVGYAMDGRMTTHLVQNAPKKALQFRQPVPGCIHHSDRGSQYCAADYRKDVKKAGMIASMSERETVMTTPPLRVSRVTSSRN